MHIQQWSIGKCITGKLIIRKYVWHNTDKVPAFASPVHRSQFSGTMLGIRVTGLLAATCTPARIYVRQQQQQDTACTSRHRVVAAAAPFPRGFVYRTARQGENNGPIEWMEGHLGYATRDAFDFFKDGEQVDLDAALRLERFFALLFISHRENNQLER